MRILSLLAAVLLVGCASTKSPSVVKVNAEQKNIKETLYYLASDELLGRDTGSEGSKLAASYLAKQLEEYKIKPYYTSYNDTLKNVKEAWNVVGVIPGTDAALKNEVVVLGAHYDHIGIEKPVDGDSIANGANDNAAGSAILLELARNLKLQDNKRTIIVAFFTGEEKGLWGAKHLAERLKADNVNVVSMLNFEMLGLPMKREYVTYLTGYDLSTMAGKLNELAGKQIVGKLAKAEEYQLFKRSDNYPFYQMFKVPCQTFSSFDFENYEYYHHVKDEAHLMDLNFMTSFTQDIIPVVAKLVNLAPGEIRMY